jgi:hypothetical protein
MGRRRLLRPELGRLAITSNVGVWVFSSSGTEATIPFVLAPAVRS